MVILLGTNGIKTRFGLSAYDIAEGARLLVSMVQASQAGIDGRSPQVLLLAPPPTATLSEYAEMFEGAGKLSLKLSRYFARVAEEMGCAFMDTGAVIASSPLDGMHFEAEEHRKLGQAVALRVRELME